MRLLFSIHNIFNVLLINPSVKIGNFIKDELWYFERNELENITLEIEFVAKIDTPEEFIYLQKNCVYSDGCLYLMTEGGKLYIPIKEIADSKINAKAERNLSEWVVLHLIEKLMSLKIIEKGCSMLHALCVEEEGDINLYAGLQGVGKTKLALRKLRNGAKFLGEEYVIVNRNSTVFCYPRGMNVHRFQEEEYYKLRYNTCLSKQINRESFFLYLLGILRIIFSPMKRIRRMIDARLNGKKIFRVNVKSLYPDVQIVESGQLNNILVFFKGHLPLLFKNSWEEERYIHFLAINNNIERLESISQCIDSFWAYGDQYSNKLQKYLNRMLLEERKIIGDALRKLGKRDNNL